MKSTTGQFHFTKYIYTEHGEDYILDCYYLVIPYGDEMFYYCFN